MKHRNARVATIFAAVLSAAAGLAAPATPAVAARVTAEAARPTPLEQVLEQMRAQIPLVAAASIVKAAVSETDAGYAGIGLVDQQVTVWWKGRLPAKVEAAVATARGKAPVTVVPAAHSRMELKKAAEKLAARIGADKPSSRYTVKSAADGSGLLVAVDPAASAPAIDGLDVPVKLTRDERKSPRSRDDDTPLWRGGAYLASIACTSGFGVRDASGARYLLTAGHCGSVGDTVTDNANEHVGSIVQDRDDHDIALVATSMAGNTVYTGGLDDEQQKVVSGWTEVFPGQLLCQSGRTMAWLTGGVMCNIEVDFHYPEGPDQGLVEATQLDGLEVAYGGDSGGSIYMLGPNGTIRAAGTLTRSLGPGLGFQDFATARADFGIEPLTGTTGPCRVTYTVHSSWSTGFNVQVTVHNDGPAISGWSLGWTFTGPGDQQIASIWQAVSTQTLQRVIVVNDASNSAIPSGGSVTFGFNGSGPATVPGLFTLNGAYCV